MAPGETLEQPAKVAVQLAEIVGVGARRLVFHRSACLWATVNNSQGSRLDLAG